MPVKPPTCRICGVPHWSTQPHDKDGLKRNGITKGSPKPKEKP